MKTKVVNIKKNNYDIYIGRTGKGKDGYYGNPFKLQKGEKRGSTLNKYKDYFFNKLRNDIEFKKRILSLRNKTLGCFCKPNDCHGDIIANYLNNLRANKIDKKEIIDFKYDGFGVESFNTVASYKIDKFIKWTNDPGIGKFLCNDGKERLIPTCQLNEYYLIELPKRPNLNCFGPNATGTLFGNPSKS